jgi:hypothetical protein
VGREGVRGAEGVALLERRSLATHRDLQFADRAALDRGTAPGIMKPLVEDFDRVWPGIPRTREIMTVVEEIGG